MGDSPDVKVADLAKRCDPAISEMIKNMENSKPGHKRVFQKLSNHLRRRAMSYDIKKVPKKMRKSVEEQVAGAAEAKARNKPSGRDPNQFRAHGRELCKHRNEKHKWLETHLWHAKRFHIKDLWGWKIPYSPTMKGTRSMIRQTSETSTLRDISYTNIIDIKGSLETINERLQSMVAPDTYIEPSLRSLFELDLYPPNKYPECAIGPAQFYRISGDHLWCICHPLLTSVIISSLEGLQVRSLEGEINIFELFGPKSTENILKALPPNKENSEQLVNTLYSLKGPGTVPPGFSISYISSDPRSVPSEYTREVTGTPVDIFSQPDLVQSLSDSSLFNGCSECPIPSNQNFNAERAKLLFPSADGPTGRLPLILIQRVTFSKFGSSWIMILPFGTGAAAWRSLVKTGARAIGLEESRLIELESNKFAFPQSRPETEEGFKEWTREMLELTKENNSKPPGKRIDLSFFEFPTPFYLTKEPIDDAFARVKIVCCRRGSPSRFAILYVPEKEDIESIGKVIELKGERKRIGVVSDGRNSLLAGKGKGIGFVNSLSFEELPSSFDLSINVEKPKNGARLAMMKEQGSQFYHHVWLYLI